MVRTYTEDADGRPHYDWTIVDRIFDTDVERTIKPLVEIGFMPQALSTKPGHAADRVRAAAARSGAIAVKY